MITRTSFFKNFLLKSLFFVLILLVGVVFWITDYFGLIFFYKAFYFDKWIAYKNPSVGISFVYPKMDAYFKVAASGWTTVYDCPPDKLVLVGDENQIYSLSICTKPDPKEVQDILADNSFKHREVTLNGKRYMEMATANEVNSNIVGRYYIPTDHSLLIGVSKGSLGDRSQLFYDILTKIDFKIIGSIQSY